MLIVFEGVNGAGKTTQLQMLADELTRRGRRVITLTSPDDSGLRCEGTLTLRAQMLYLTAALRHLNDSIVWPLITHGNSVILMERGVYNIIATCGYGENAVERAYKTVMPNVTDNLREAHTIFLDISADEARQRCPSLRRSPVFTRPNYLERTANGLRCIAEEQPTWHTVNGHYSNHTIHRSIIDWYDTLQESISSVTVGSRNRDYNDK